MSLRLKSLMVTSSSPLKLINHRTKNCLATSSHYHFPIHHDSDFLHFMEQHRVCANTQTYLHLLEATLGSRSFVSVAKHHSRVLKLGFDGEAVPCGRLLEACISFGDLGGAAKLVDEMSRRSLTSWNRIIRGFLASTMAVHVLALYQKMTMENTHPDEAAFAGILKACTSYNIDVRRIQQVHARVVCHGFGDSLAACNMLVRYKGLP